jgi:hypothetical protein
MCYLAVNQTTVEQLFVIRMERSKPANLALRLLGSLSALMKNIVFPTDQLEDNASLSRGQSRQKHV